GLAVRPGDEHRLPAVAELLHQCRVDLQGDEPSDHRALTASGLLGRPRGGSGCAQCEPSTCGDSCAGSHVGECSTGAGALCRRRSVLLVTLRCPPWAARAPTMTITPPIREDGAGRSPSVIHA